MPVDVRRPFRAGKPNGAGNAVGERWNGGDVRGGGGIQANPSPLPEPVISLHGVDLCP